MQAPSDLALPLVLLPFGGGGEISFQDDFHSDCYNVNKQQLSLWLSSSSGESTIMNEI